MSENNKRSFWVLMVTQFFGAFNDNSFKIIVALLVIKWVDNPITENNWKTVFTIVFGAPFILFSLLAGRLPDRFSKTAIVRATKVFEVFLVFMPLMMAALGPLNVCTFVAILLGSTLGTFIITNLRWVTWLMVIAALGGSIGSYSMARLPVANPSQTCNGTPGQILFEIGEL